MVQNNRESVLESSIEDVVEGNGEKAVGEDGGGQGARVASAEEDMEAVATGDASGESRDRLRHTTSKIANLRATFEKQDGEGSPEGKRRFSKSPARGIDQETETSRLKEQHAGDIARLKELQETEIVRLKEQHQSETANLKQQLGKEVEMRHAFEDKCTSLEDQIDALQGQLAHKTAEKHSEMEQKTRTLQQEKAKAQDEASNLQKQLFELKRSISASTRIDNEVSDSSFTQQFQHLYHETQNWVVNNFRKVKIEISAQEMCTRLGSIAEPKQLGYLKPIFENFDAAIKLAAFQATVVCYMMEIFEEPLLFGLPTQQDWRRSIKKAAETLPAILSPAAFNRWRSMTLDTIRQSESGEIKAALESAAKSMAEMICITLNTLTEAEESPARVTSLHAIIKRAISLSHLFRVQRARYEFRLPTPSSTFEASAMEDTSYAEGEVSSPAEDRTVRCATFPSVLKLGDENGDKDEVSNVVVKAMVVCNS